MRRNIDVPLLAASPAQPRPPCHTPPSPQPSLPPAINLINLTGTALKLNAGKRHATSPDNVANTDPQAGKHHATNPDSMETYIPMSLRPEIRQKLRESKAYRAYAKDKLRVKKATLKKPNKVRYAYRQANAQAAPRSRGRFKARASVAPAIAPAAATMSAA